MPPMKKIKLTTKKKQPQTETKNTSNEASSGSNASLTASSADTKVDQSSHASNTAGTGVRQRENGEEMASDRPQKRTKLDENGASAEHNDENKGTQVSSSSGDAASPMNGSATEQSGQSAQDEEEERKREKQRKRLERLAALKQKGEFGKKNTSSGVTSGSSNTQNNSESNALDSAKQKKLEEAKKAAQRRRLARLEAMKKSGKLSTSAASTTDSDSTVTAQSGAGNSSSTSASSDPLDEYLSTLGYNGPGTHREDVAARHSITLEEIMGDSSTQDSNSNETDRSSQEGNEQQQGSNTEQEQTYRPDDEEYLKEFIERLKGRKKEEEEANSKAEQNKEGQSMEATGTGRIFEEDIDEGAPVDSENLSPEERKSALEILHEKMAKKDLQPVDHSKIDYIDFRKCFYIPAPEVKNLSEQEVAKFRDESEMKVRGRNVPNPVRNWEDCGLSDTVMSVLHKLRFEEPFPIQRQALPVIMSGRDMIGVAKTGSGKTAAYLIPMFRHILDQPRIREYEGPIGLIMAPSRELVAQIYSVAKKFASALGLRTTAVYGGASIAEQIANLKRGSDIVVCSPGRMIDLLTLNSGRVLSLERVTYLVLDEADRMFDMGFEPQIKRIIQNTRPDRQTVMFSATFPSHVESLARKILANPVEIVVGGRAKSSSDVEQVVEVRSEDSKFKRLLQLLGEWYERGRILIFVDTKEHCDLLFAELMRAGYDPVSLHGGKDQFDRDSTIADFKNGRKTVMAATSVAGRGLDVKDLELVINYNCPNHLEDYVHRVGRTGRAGKKGTAYTFITPEEAQYAPDLVKALRENKQDVPEELQKLANDHNQKVKKGEARKRRSGYSTKGFKFDGTDLSEEQWQELLDRLRHDISAGNADAYELEKAEEEYKQWKQSKEEKRQRAQERQQPTKSSAPDAKAMDARAQAAARAADIQRQLGMPVDASAGYEDELEINDYPQRARWKIQTKDIVDNYIPEYSECAVSTRGVYVPPGKNPPSGERRLHLYIEGPTKTAVAKAKAELKRILEETTMKIGFDPEQYAAMPGF
eukprot:gb/GECG01009581.1/.p1 GENE.gb/GECG01009581.1/~~gb/GECG01009581.1/.p1  ORF type:complete len:1041 (+),score=200.89 gb/GECG01009581.1/:1-3123(+)